MFGSREIQQEKLEIILSGRRKIGQLVNGLMTAVFSKAEMARSSLTGTMSNFSRGKQPTIISQNNNWIHWQNMPL